MSFFPNEITELETRHRGIFVVYVKHPTEDKIVPLRVTQDGLATSLLRDFVYDPNYRTYGPIDAGATVDLDAVEVSRFLTKTFFVRADSNSIVFKVQCSFDGENWFDVTGEIATSGNENYYHRYSTTDAFKYMRIVIRNTGTAQSNAGAAYCLQV